MSFQVMLLIILKASQIIDSLFYEVVNWIGYLEYLYLYLFDLKNMDRWISALK